MRLESAAKLILYSEKSVGEIAIEVGYDSIQAFRKAFKAHFDHPPSYFKKNKELLVLERFEVVQQQFYPEQFPWEITTLEAMQLVCARVRGSYDSLAIDTLWEALHDYCDVSGVDCDLTKPIGIIQDDEEITEEHMCTYEACFPLREQVTITSNEFYIKELPERRYAKFLHKGSYRTLSDTYRWIHGHWLVKEPYQFSEHPAIEVYVKNELHTSNEAHYETEVYLPIL